MLKCSSVSPISFEDISVKKSDRYALVFGSRLSSLSTPDSQLSDVESWLIACLSARSPSKMPWAQTCVRVGSGLIVQHRCAALGSRPSTLGSRLFDSRLFDSRLSAHVSRLTLIDGGDKPPNPQRPPNNKTFAGNTSRLRN